jgi:hypothetical protein
MPPFRTQSAYALRQRVSSPQPVSVSRPTASPLAGPVGRGANHVWLFNARREEEAYLLAREGLCGCSGKGNVIWSGRCCRQRKKWMEKNSSPRTPSIRPCGRRQRVSSDDGTIATMVVKTATVGRSMEIVGDRGCGEGGDGNGGQLGDLGRFGGGYDGGWRLRWGGDSGGW